VATIGKLKREFLSTVRDARALFNHCLTPRAAHTDAGVEAAFLQSFKAWEGLLEEATLCYLCGRLSSDGRSVGSYVSAPNEDIARLILYHGKNYILWTDIEEVQRRMEYLFGKANRFHLALSGCAVELKHMSTVRNAIAHSSYTANKKFYDLLKTKFGGMPKYPPSQYLISPDPSDPLTTIFDRYMTVLEVAGTMITG
jgi:hypothetical protein